MQEALASVCQRVMHQASNSNLILKLPCGYWPQVKAEFAGAPDPEWPQTAMWQTHDGQVDQCVICFAEWIAHNSNCGAILHGHKRS